MSQPTYFATRPDLYISMGLKHLGKNCLQECGTPNSEARVVHICTKASITYGGFGDPKTLLVHNPDLGNRRLYSFESLLLVCSSFR
jgi:hypothetical protein